jgi:AbiU2
MAERRTAQQVRDEHLERLGPTLGPLYFALYNDVVWLHAKWNQYRILFAESPERIELLNGVAGFFFRMIHEVLLENVVLHVARLIDPPQSGTKKKKDNLTLSRLKAAVEEKAPELIAEIAKLVGRARTEASFIKEWRDRRIAHRDLKLAMNDPIVRLPEISCARMERVLLAVRAILNEVEYHFWQGSIGFEHFIAHDDAENLVHYLKAAVDSESQERERVLRSLKRRK